MSNTLVEQRSLAGEEERGAPVPSLFARLRPWLLSGELYLVIAVATFLRLFAFGTTEFDRDEAAFFHMARNALSHGYIPATSNFASVHMYSPPAVVYLLLPAAILTDNPLAGALTVALVAIAAVVLTYLFARIYYGRLAATIAALSYATLFRAVVYARFIWNPNFLPLFIVLFFMSLFQGAVARRKGWLWAALLLLGWCIQLHASCIFLTFPLLIALALAPGTIRRRDVVLGTLALLIIYAPYIIWELAAHFTDGKALWTTASSAKSIDDYAWQLYQVLLNPYDILRETHPLHWHVVPFLGESSWLWQLARYLRWISQILITLVVACILWAGLRALWPTRLRTFEEQTRHSPALHPLLRYWRDLRASPSRCGLLILFSWQTLPLLLLVRHDKLYLHYLIFLLPGPCILLSIGLGTLSKWMRIISTHRAIAASAHYGVVALAALIIIAQAIGTTAGILDLDQGRYSDGSSARNLYNDLRSLQTAVNEADHLAQEQHLNRVYISTDWPTQDSLHYLSTRMHTPTTLFQVDKHDCVVLPDPAQGPAVMLIGPYSPLADELVRTFASARLVSKPARAGGAPFRLYIVETRFLPDAPHAILGNDLQLLNTPAQSWHADNTTPFLVSQWKLLRSVRPEYHRVYNYDLTLSANGVPQSVTTSHCAFTSIRPGDHVIAAFKTPRNLSRQPMQNFARTGIDIQARAYENYLYSLKYGPFMFQTDYIAATPSQLLQTREGKDRITLSVTGL